MQQIRITRTPELDKVLASLREKYRLLSEAEIIKVVLSDRYYKENEREESLKKDRKLRKMYKNLMKEGKKIGIRLMKEKGLDPNKVTEQQFYDLFLDTHKHK